MKISLVFILCFASLSVLMSGCQTKVPPISVPPVLATSSENRYPGPETFPPTPRAVLLNVLPVTIVESTFTVNAGGTSSAKFAVQTDLKDTVAALLPHVAKHYNLKIGGDMSRRDNCDIIIVLEDVAPVSSDFVKRDECQADLTLRVRCYDGNGQMLGTASFSGTGTSKNPSSAALVGAGFQPFLSFVNLDANYTAEHTALVRSALQAASQAALVQLANEMNDPFWLRGMLIHDIVESADFESTKRAIYFFDDQDYRRAFWYLEETVKRYPRYQPGLCYYGATLAHLGQLQLASEILQRAVILEPDTQEADSARQWLQVLEQCVQK